MKRITFLLLLLPSLVFGQIDLKKKAFFYVQAAQALGENLYPQSVPTLSSPQTRAASGLTLAGSIFTVDLTSHHVLLSGAFSGGAALNGILGERGNPYLFTNENSSTLIGTTSNSTAAIGTVNVTNYIELWGKASGDPLKIRAGSGQSGIVLNPQVDGSVFRVYNVQGMDIGYSTLLYSAPSSGGSYYKKNSIAWLARNGLVTEGEHIYLGHVSTETIFEKNSITQCAALDAGREGLQIKWAEQSRVYNSTFKNVGQVSDAAQQHAFQVEVSADTEIVDCIFDGAKRSVNLFTHDLTVKGGVIRWTNSAGYIGKASSFWPGNAKLNGEKILFDGVTFIFDNADTDEYFAQWDDTDVDLEFRNCIFSDNINSAIVDDNRAGSPTNDLIGTTTTNGNSVVAKATLLARMPTYVSEDEDNVDFMNVPPGSYWFNRGVGKGTPSNRTTIILDAKESRDTTVAYNTTFAELDLPTVAWVLTSTGYWQYTPVSWAVGDYDETVDDTYTIYGTPTGIANPDSVKVEKRITVEPEPPSYNVILLSLKGTGSSPYVSTGNWNHAPQSYSTGAITIYGDNSSSSLASLRDTNGSLTGYGVSITSQFEGNDSRGMNSAGAYPANANRSSWEHAGGTGTTRVFTITGLNNSIAYTFKVLASLDTFFNGNMDVTISGASGGGTTINDFNANSNVNTAHEFPAVYPSGGVVTITVLRNSGQCGINVIEINWEN